MWLHVDQRQKGPLTVVWFILTQGSSVGDWGLSQTKDDSMAHRLWSYHISQCKTGSKTAVTTNSDSVTNLGRLSQCDCCHDLCLLTNQINTNSQ